MNNHTDCARALLAGHKDFDLSQRQIDKSRLQVHQTNYNLADARLQRRHPMKSTLVWAMPVATMFLFGNGSSAFADTSDVKGPAPVIVAKSGEHCKDDPNSTSGCCSISSSAEPPDIPAAAC